jgi:hypothetical protein
MAQAPKGEMHPEPVDERLQNIEPRLIEMIRNEVAVWGGNIFRCCTRWIKLVGTTLLDWSMPRIPSRRSSCGQCSDRNP